jgi:cytochrome c5
MNFISHILTLKLVMHKSLFAPVRAARLFTTMLFATSSAFATNEYTVELYETYCKACHSVAGAGVPVAFKLSDWEKRIEKGFDKVVMSAINGVGNMPAQGSCQECVYEDFEDLVTYMSNVK